MKRHALKRDRVLDRRLEGISEIVSVPLRESVDRIRVEYSRALSEVRSVPHSRSPCALKTGLRLGCVAVALGSLPTSRQTDKDDIDVATLGAIQPPLVGQVRQSKRRGRSVTSGSAAANEVVVEDETVTETLDRLLRHTFGSALFADPRDNTEEPEISEGYGLSEASSWKLDSPAAVTGQYTKNFLVSRDHEIVHEISGGLTTREDALVRILAYDGQLGELGSTDADEIAVQSALRGQGTSYRDILPNGIGESLNVAAGHDNPSMQAASETSLPSQQVLRYSTQEVREEQNDNVLPGISPSAMDRGDKRAQVSRREIGNPRATQEQNADIVYRHEDGETAPTPFFETAAVDMLGILDTGPSEARGTIEDKAGDLPVQSLGDGLFFLPGDLCLHESYESGNVPGGVVTLGDGEREASGSEDDCEEKEGDVSIDPQATFPEPAPRVEQEQSRRDGEGTDSYESEGPPPPCTDMKGSAGFQSVTLRLQELTVTGISISGDGDGDAGCDADGDGRDPCLVEEVSVSHAGALTPSHAPADGTDAITNEFLSDAELGGDRSEVGESDAINRDASSSGMLTTQVVLEMEGVCATRTQPSLPLPQVATQSGDVMGDDERNPEVNQVEAIGSEDDSPPEVEEVEEVTAVRVKVEAHSKGVVEQTAEFTEAGRESSEESPYPRPAVAATQTGITIMDQVGEAEAVGEAVGEAGDIESRKGSATNHRVPRDRPSFHFPQPAESGVAPDMVSNLPAQLAELSSSLENSRAPHEAEIAGSWQQQQQQQQEQEQSLYGYGAYVEGPIRRVREEQIFIVGWIHRWTKGLAKWVDELLEWRTSAQKEIGGPAAVARWVMDACQSRTEAWMYLFQESVRATCRRLQRSARATRENILRALHEHMGDPILAQAL